MKAIGILMIIMGVTLGFIMFIGQPKRIELCNHGKVIANKDINTECIKGARYVIVDDPFPRKIRLKKFDKNALNQVSDIYCY